MNSRQPIQRPNPLDQITAEAILASLSQEGIRTLDQFAHRYADAVRASMQANPGLQSRFGPAFALPGDVAPKALKHRIPTYALTVDGVPIDPKAISKYHGQALRFFITAEMHAEHRFAAYTSEDGLKQAVEAHAALSGPILPRASTGNNTGFCFENIGFGGATLKIPRMSDWWNFTLPDLTQVYRSNFLWWGWNPWNDVISSIKSEDHTLHFFEDIHLSGSMLIVSPQVQLTSLVPLGWNDRISSLAIGDL
jgi:hypothetical protein